MTSSRPREASSTSLPTGGERARPPIAIETADFDKLARHMYALMLRNVASEGFQVRDPFGELSVPGCIIAAPSYPANTPGIDQDYVYHWVRDAAITIAEITAATAAGSGDDEALVDYVTFAKLCQGNSHPTQGWEELTLAHAVFNIDGTPRKWTEQSDGPAMQILAILRFFARLDAATQAIAREVMQTNLDFLLTAYQGVTRNLWEEVDGFTFFTRSVQLACLRAVAASDVGLNVSHDVQAAIAWLERALSKHWNDTIYVSVLPPPPGSPPGLVSPGDGYDPNIDIICAALYGAVPVTDPKLLATAAALRQQWEDPTSPYFYPVNGTDKALGVGPLLGRYPSDHYDGDVAHPVLGGHPWALCSANLAELYYRVANAINRDGQVPADPLAKPFLAQIGAEGADADTTKIALRAAGDAILRAILRHSDHLELSEQFDGASGYERSVRNLTWSYAAFLSAVRARTGGIV